MKNMKKVLAGLTLGLMVMGAAALAIKPAEAFGGMYGGGYHQGGGGGYHGRYADMTDAQKADWKARHDQMVQWRKKDLQAEVAAGRITQKDADERIERMHTRFKDMQDGKFESFRGHRYADMTDAQKAEFKARHDQMAQWHKKDLQAAVDAGRITQKDADERIARMNARFKDMQDGKTGMHSRGGGYGQGSKGDGGGYGHGSRGGRS